jgi:hypothetical protein
VHHLDGLHALGAPRSGLRSAPPRPSAGGRGRRQQALPPRKLEDQGLVVGGGKVGDAGIRQAVAAEALPPAGARAARGRTIRGRSAVSVLLLLARMDRAASLLPMRYLIVSLLLFYLPCLVEKKAERALFPERLLPRRPDREGQSEAHPETRLATPHDQQPQQRHSQARSGLEGCARPSHCAFDGTTAVYCVLSAALPRDVRRGVRFSRRLALALVFCLFGCRRTRGIGSVTPSTGR